MRALWLLDTSPWQTVSSLLDEAERDCESARQGAARPDAAVWTTLGWTRWVRATGWARLTEWLQAVDFLEAARGYFARAIALTNGHLREAAHGMTAVAETAAQWSTLDVPLLLARRIRIVGATELWVRPCVADDLDRIMEIEAVSFGVDAYPRRQFDELQAEHPDGFFVAEVQGRVVGYIVGDLNDAGGQVDSIAVELATRRAGFGRELAERLLDHLQRMGAERCSLEVRPENKVAIRFYEGLGFSVIG
jgi:ribosomal-protein-alanine N-acetyltransferase